MSTSSIGALSRQAFHRSFVLVGLTGKPGAGGARERMPAVANRVGAASVASQGLTSSAAPFVETVVVEDCLPFASSPFKLRTTLNERIMFGWWRRKMEPAMSGFDKKTESIENHAQVDREIERIESETRELFNQAVTETAALIETLKDPEDRALVRAWALQEFRSVAPAGGPGDVSRLMPPASKREDESPGFSIQ